MQGFGTASLRRRFAPARVWAGGRGWWDATVGALTNSHAGYTLLSNKPVLVEDPTQKRDSASLSCFTTTE